MCLSAENKVVRFEYANCVTKSSQATSHVKWLNGEKISVSRTISVLVLRVLKWLEFPSVSYIYLPEPRVHGCALANGDWWVESSVGPVSPSFLIG
jgi:hypothetical protein